jgi:hypothetical protein
VVRRETDPAGGHVGCDYFWPAARKRLILVEEFDAYEGCADADIGEVPAGTSPPSVSATFLCSE